jgi:hypothetical protein
MQQIMIPVTKHQYKNDHRGWKYIVETDHDPHAEFD